jgi:hypothetical protein
MTRGTIKAAERIRNNTYEDKVRSMFSTWTAKVKWLIEHHAQMSAMVADCELRQIFQPIDHDAKKGQVLLDVGLPWPVVGIYNSESQDWSYANMQAEQIDGEYYYYYETEHENNPRGYMPMPTI